MGVLAFVAIGGGDALSVIQGGLCLLELPGLDERRAQVCVEPTEGRIVAWEQSGRAVQEVSRRDVVAAVVRGAPGRVEVCGGPERQRGGLGVSGPKFVAVADRLFEVIAEDLRTAGERVREDGLERVRVAVVQLGSKGLGDRAVSRLVDEDVPEAVLLMGVSAGPTLHQALGDEGLEVAAERRARLGREQFPDFRLAEVLADDGGPYEDAARSRSKALQACRQQGLNRGRQRRPDVASALLAEGDRQ